MSQKQRTTEKKPGQARHSPIIVPIPFLGEPGLFIGCRSEAAEAPAGQGVATETPAGVLVKYAEEVEGAQRSPVG